MSKTETSPETIQADNNNTSTENNNNNNQNNNKSEKEMLHGRPRPSLLMPSAISNGNSNPSDEDSEHNNNQNNNKNSNTKYNNNRSYAQEYHQGSSRRGSMRSNYSNGGSSNNNNQNNNNNVVNQSLAYNYNNSNLFLRNLSGEVEQKDLNEIFSQFGTIMSSAIMRNIHTGESLGTAFVRYEKHEEARAAMEYFSNINAPQNKIKGKAISIQWAKKHDGAPVGEARRKITKLFVRNIPISVTVEDLTNLFSKYGPVERVTIHKDTSPPPPSPGNTPTHPHAQNNNTNNNNSQNNNLFSERHIAFIIYAAEGAAEKAANAVHNTVCFDSCEGIPLMVKLAEDNYKKHGYNNNNNNNSQNNNNNNNAVPVSPNYASGSNLATPTMSGARNNNFNKNNNNSIPTSVSPSTPNYISGSFSNNNNSVFTPSSVPAPRSFQSPFIGGEASSLPLHLNSPQPHQNFQNNNNNNGYYNTSPTPLNYLQQHPSMNQNNYSNYNNNNNFQNNNNGSVLTPLSTTSQRRKSSLPFHLNPSELGMQNNNNNNNSNRNTPATTPTSCKSYRHNPYSVDNVITETTS